MQTVFECDRIFLAGNDANIANASDSGSVTFSKIYDDPVVVSHTATNSGGQPVDDRVTNVTGSGCDIFAHEPDQQGHADNTHTYFVAESGVHETAEGHLIEAGTHKTKTNNWNDAWDGNSVNFEADWDSPPVVVATVNTHNNELFATPGVSNVTTDGFELSLISEDNENTHVETIGWIAFPDAGAIQMDGVPVESSVISGGSATFSQSFSTKPDYVADNMGHNGTGAWVRGNGWTSTDISWYDESGGLPAPYGYVAVAENSVIESYDGDSFYSGTFSYLKADQIEYDWYDTSELYSNRGHPTNASEFDDYFDSGRNDVVFGGTGLHTRRIYFGTNLGDSKPSYLPADGFSWRARGYVYAPQSGTYYFGIDGDDAIDLHVNGNLLVGWYGGHGSEGGWSHNASISLEQGLHEIVVRSEEGGGGDSTGLGWQKPSDGSISPIPIGSYYGHRDFIPGTGYDGLDSNGDPKNGGGHYAGTIDHRGTVHTPPTAATAFLNTRTTGAFTSTSSIATAETAALSPSSIRSEVTVDSATVAALTSDFSASGLSASSSLISTTGITTGVKIAKGTTEVTATGSVTSASTGTKQATANLTYDGPGSVTASRNSDTSITVSWTKTNSEADQFRVQMSRDGAAWTDPASGATTDASNTSLTVYHESDNAYDAVVGIDSEFDFRVRAEGSDTSSNWNIGEAAYTTPIPPHAPSASRDNSDTVRLEWDSGSRPVSTMEIQRRDDSGSGYGSWNTIDTVTEDKYYAISAGNNNGESADTQNWVNGTNHSPGGRGMNLALIRNGSFVESKTWDTYGSVSESDSMETYLEGLNSGDVVIITAKDEASSNLTSTLTSTIENRLFSTEISNLGYRHSWAIISTVDNQVHSEDRREIEEVSAEYSPSRVSYYTDTPASDSRYQYRIRNTGYTGLTSGWVYTDYGNRGNVYFSDDFESGDISAWDSSHGGHSVGGGSHADTGVSGPDEGSNYLKGYGASSTESTWVQKNLGDLSGETDVLVKCAFAWGSMDNTAEDFGIDWYDGSAWQNLKYGSAEYNRQGWVEFQTLVPSSWLSSDNRIRVGTTTASGMYGGDYFAVDRVVVSDVLHELTKPAAPSDLSVSSDFTSVSYSFTDNMSIQSQSRPFGDLYDSNGNRLERNFGDSGTHTGLTEDTQYEIRTRNSPDQWRRGERDTWFGSNGPSEFIFTLNSETSTVTTTEITSSFDPSNPSTSLTTSGVVGSSTSTFESGGDSSAVSSGKAGVSTQTSTGIGVTTADSQATSSGARADGVTASADTGTQTGRSVQATSATEIGSTGDSVTAAEGSVPELGATPTEGDGSVQTIADGGLVVSSSDTKPSGAATSAESSTGLPRASTTTSVGVGSTTTESPADVAGAQADGVSSEETTAFSVAETETATTDTIQSRGEVISNASVTASDAVPKTGTAATTATADGSDKTVGTNSFGMASTVAAVTAGSFDGMLATPKAAKPEASTTAVGETVNTTTSTRGIGLSGIGVKPLQQNFTTETRLGIGSPEGFSGGRSSVEVSVREGVVESQSSGGNVTSSAVSPALPAVYTQSQSFAVSALVETNVVEASSVTTSEGGSVVDIVTSILTNGTALSNSRSKTHSSTDVRTARTKLVAGLTPMLVESETFESSAFTQSDGSGVSETAGLSSTSEAATSTVADASVTSTEVSPQQPAVEAQAIGVGDRPDVQSDTLESAVLSESLSESTTATVTLQETGEVYTTTTVKSESNAQVQALPGFGTTTATAIINAIDGMVMSPVVSGAFTTTTSDALTSGFDALGKNRLDPKTASVAVVPTTIVEATAPRTPVDVYTKTTADGRETVVFGVGTIAEPYTETTSLAIQQQVTVDDVDSAFGLTTLLTKGDEFDAENKIIETEADQSPADTDVRTSYDTEADQDDYETDGEY